MITIAYHGDEAFSSPLTFVGNHQCNFYCGNRSVLIGLKVAIDRDRALVLLHEGKLLEKSYLPNHLMNSPGIGLPAAPNPETVYSGQIILTEGDWRSAFDKSRRFPRAQLDLTEYSREDLKWYEVAPLKKCRTIFREHLD